MANNLLTNDIILKTALMEFENNLALTKAARRDYQNRFDATTGSNIRIRKPTRYEARTGRTASPQDIDSQYTNLTVGSLVGVDVNVTSEQWALQLDDFNREVINPAMVTLANKIDMMLYEKAKEFYLFAGTAGTAPNAYSVVRNAATVLNARGVPQKDRFLMLESADAGVLQSALYNTFNENFNKSIIMDGSMGNLASFDCYDVQNVQRPSRGSDSLGTPAINGASQSGSTLVLDGFTAAVSLKKGALFTIAGVNALNPTSRNDIGQLAQFTVTADATADGSGNMTLSISPEIVVTGPYRNVTALPADNALLTFQATHTKNIFFHKEAFALVTVNLPILADNKSAWQKNMVNPKGTNINMRMGRQANLYEDQELIRFDILPALGLFPEYGGILMGS